MTRRKKMQTESKVSEDTNESSVYPPYKPSEPQIVEPKLHTYAAMLKDAGAGVKKFFKASVMRDNNNICTLTVKSGKFGHKISAIKEKFDDFTTACEKAEKLIKEKQARGYKIQE
jgi:predicted DNA-binding WGR domain protein